MHNYFQILQNSFTIIFAIALLFAQTAANAAPALSENQLNVAMLDALSLEFEPHQRSSLKQLKTKESNEVFPDDCMTWNIGQINRKAKPYIEHILKHARQYEIDSNLVKSVITAESCFKRKALSSAGARGLMQLIPDTADRFGVKDSYDPEQNIRGGVKYLRFLYDRYEGELEKMIAAYNAGEGVVDRYKGIPPYKETKQYVKNVLETYQKFQTSPGINNSKKQAVKPLGLKPGRGGWQYNRLHAPHLFKK